MLKHKQVRCLDIDGQEIGVIEFSKAFRLSEDRRLDLVELSADAKPPVVKLMNYGKFLYNKRKKSKDSKKSAKLKEIQLHVNISKGDLETKLNKAKYFLEKKTRLKISLRFRGREMVHTNLGSELFDRVIEEMKDDGTLEAKPQMQGRSMFMSFNPKK